MACYIRGIERAQAHTICSFKKPLKKCLTRPHKPRRVHFNDERVLSKVHSVFVEYLPCLCRETRSRRTLNNFMLFFACECYGILKSSRQPENEQRRHTYKKGKKVLDKRDDLWENTFNERGKPTPIEAAFSRWISAKDSTTTAAKVVAGTWA